MKKRVSFLRFIVLILFLLSLTSFKPIRKYHLIVGGWQIIDTENVHFNNIKDYYIEQLSFSSDEFTSSFHLVAKNKTEKSLDLAYKIYEKDIEFEKPVIVYKNTCDKKFLLVFTIEQLTKDTLEIKLQEKYTPKDLRSDKSILKFERIAYIDDDKE